MPGQPCAHWDLLWLSLITLFSLMGTTIEWALGEHILVSYLFTAAGELTKGLGGQWALLSPGLSCDSMGWPVSTSGCTGSMFVQAITHVNLPCFSVIHGRGS